MGRGLKLGRVQQRITAQVTCQCSEIIMKSMSGVDKIRAKVVLVKDGGVFAVCKGCGVEVKVPLQKSPGPRLFTRK